MATCPTTTEGNQRLLFVQGRPMAGGAALRGGGQIAGAAARATRQSAHPTPQWRRLHAAVGNGAGSGNSVNNGGGLGMDGGSTDTTIRGCCCMVEGIQCQGFAGPPPPRDNCTEYRYRVDVLGQDPCKEENHRLLCECIAYGCNPGGVRGCIPNPYAQYHRCGCEKFGGLDPWKGTCCRCQPGRIMAPDGGGGNGGGSGGGGPKALMSPGGGCAQCGGGGGAAYSPSTDSIPEVIAPSCLLHFPSNTLRGAAVAACWYLMRCSCLPPQVRECIGRLCSKPIRINCVFVDPKHPNLPCSGKAGRFTKGGAGCAKGDPGLWMWLCMLEWSQGSGRTRGLTRAIVHEMLHHCDCFFGTHRQDPECMASMPGGGGGQPLDEGFAQACENACFMEDTSSYQFAGKPPTKDWCCLCKQCYA